MRVKVRKASGGHDVPGDKIISRYHKALKLIPELLGICDNATYMITVKHSLEYLKCVKISISFGKTRFGVLIKSLN